MGRADFEQLSDMDEDSLRALLSRILSIYEDTGQNGFGDYIEKELIAIGLIEFDPVEDEGDMYGYD